MAKDKKSFIAYSDWKGTFDALSNEKAGELIKHIFAYVNDEDPISEDMLINAVFSNIKNTLKRDLQRWEKQHNQRREAGKRSAEVRKRNATAVNGRSISSTDSVSVSVSDSVNVSANVSETILLKKETKKVFNFKKELISLGFDKDLVEDWLKVRKTKKASNTKTALNTFLNQVKNCNLDKNVILETCVSNSWSGFKAEWLNKNQNNENRNNNNGAKSKGYSKDEINEGFDKFFGIGR